MAGAFYDLFERPALRVMQPAIWPYEVINGLRAAHVCGRLDEDQSRRAIVDLTDLPIDIEGRLPKDGAADLFELARLHTLSAYDAAYVQFCLLMNSTLWTLDAQLRRAAKNAGVATL